jgi:hypothetical protein
VIGNIVGRKTVGEANECEDLEGILGVDDSNRRGRAFRAAIKVEGPGTESWLANGRAAGAPQGSV